MASTEIDDLYNAAVYTVEKDIFGLEIPMNDVTGVAISNSRKDLLYDACGVLFTELSSIRNFVKKFATSAKFGHQIVPSLVLIELVQPQDVWVILTIF